jgi:hypothetical protein
MSDKKFIVIKYAYPEEWQVEAIRDSVLETATQRNCFLTTIADTYFGSQVNFETYDDAYFWACATELHTSQAIIVFKEDYLSRAFGEGKTLILERETLFELHEEMKAYLRETSEQSTLLNIKEIA